jgi:hypothetical protein
MNDQDLDRLFAEYRESLPDPEPTAAFMPSLWRAIEARQTFRMRFGRLSRVFVTAAGAIWLAMAVLLIGLSARMHPRAGQDYDLLADSHSTDSIDLVMSPGAPGSEK